ncbi:phosphotriesterase family protein [Dactylosporangium sp. CA-092794]|uniref:phosphotriesterase family protein n=1 Tax=Dactylosporangium sp. CA-092794 TaxID=3239929 RepID=UPI003D8AF002
MYEVQTARGPVPTDQLGATLMHEHIFVRNAELEENFPIARWDEERAHETAVEGLNRLHDKGIRTIVDLTVMGLGRSIPRIQRIARAVDVNIVLATGYYTARDLPGYFQHHGPGRLVDMQDPLEKTFLRDIQVGIGETDLRAGVIKVVTDEPGLTPDVQRVMRAAACAQMETGVPISTHTNAQARTGLLQQEFFRQQGVDLTRVVIGHCGDTTDVDYLMELMDNGSSIGLDRFGVDWVLPDDERIATAVRLCELGYADRITLSHDAAFFLVNSPPRPRWTHFRISDEILPALRTRGVSENTLQQIMVDNPARILGAR